MYENPYEVKQKIAIAELNKLLRENLDLAADFYQGDAVPGEHYGFLFPRELTPPDQINYGGINIHSLLLDVLVEFSIGPDENMQLAGFQYLSKVSGLIMYLNRIKSVGNFTGQLEVGKLSAVPKQLFRKPHNIQVSIVGSATLEVLQYHDNCGTPVLINC